jgi:large subunit ribosomal protein L13
MNVQKTYLPKLDEIQKKWYVIDAADQTLGRLASEVAVLLRGKHKPMFTPNLDTGDWVVIVNAEKVKVTGRKEEQKTYHRHSGRFGNLKTITLKDMRRVLPCRVIELAVRRMLPKSPLGKRLFTHLKVYAGGEHPHAAQKPEIYTLSRSRSGKRAQA